MPLIGLFESLIVCFMLLIGLFKSLIVCFMPLIGLFESLIDCFMALVDHKIGIFSLPINLPHQPEKINEKAVDFQSKFLGDEGEDTRAGVFAALRMTG